LFINNNQVSKVRVYQKLMLKELKDGFGVANQDVLPKENILVVVKNNNIMLNFELEFDKATTIIVVDGF